MEYRITKKFLFPGKGEAEIPTLTLTPRGLVFTFPRRLATLDEELEFKDIDGVVVECLKEFREKFPEKKIVRVGLIEEYVYSTGGISGARLICDRFTRLAAPASEEVVLKINLATDEYNRTIEMTGVHKIEPVPEIPGRSQTTGHGLKVKLDVNNRDMSKDLDTGSIMAILQEGRTFDRRDLYRFLNGELGGVQ